MQNLDVTESPNGFSVRTMEVPPKEMAYLLKADGWTKRMADQAHQAFRPEDFDGSEEDLFDPNMSDPEDEVPSGGPYHGEG